MKSKKPRNKVLAVLFWLVFLLLAFVAGTYEYAMIYDVLNGPVEMKVPIGTARVFFPPLDLNVTLDGKPVDGARCFLELKFFDGRPARRLILWLPLKNTRLGRDIITVDLERPAVGEPSARRQDFALWLGFILFQSDSGDLITPYDDVAKGLGIDPELLISDDEISFYRPEYRGGEYILKRVVITGASDGALSGIMTP